MEKKTLRRMKVISVCFFLLPVSGEVSGIPVQESKNYDSNNSEESLQSVADIPSDFNSLIFSGDNADILRALLLVVFEAMLGAYLLAVFEFDMGTL